MIKKKKEEPTNGQNNGQMDALIKLVTDLQQQVQDFESRKGTDAAKLLIADQMYNTPKGRKRELTVLPLRAVRSLALADTVGSILSPEVQAGKTTLGEVWRDSHYSHMRSVKGLFVNMGKDLAMEEKRGEENPDLGEESALGKGL